MPTCHSRKPSPAFATRCQKAAAKALRKHPRLEKLHDAVFDLPRIRAYAESGRRLAFNNDDLFRNYPELDG